MRISSWLYSEIASIFLIFLIWLSTLSNCLMRTFKSLFSKDFIDQLVPLTVLHLVFTCSRKHSPTNKLLASKKKTGAIKIMFFTLKKWAIFFNLFFVLANLFYLNFILYFFQRITLFTKDLISFLWKVIHYTFQT